MNTQPEILLSSANSCTLRHKMLSSMSSVMTRSFLRFLALMQSVLVLLLYKFPVNEFDQFGCVVEVSSLILQSKKMNANFETDSEDEQLQLTHPVLGPDYSSSDSDDDNDWKASVYASPMNKVQQFQKQRQLQEEVRECSICFADLNNPAITAFHNHVGSVSSPLSGPRMHSVCENCAVEQFFPGSVVSAEKQYEAEQRYEEELNGNRQLKLRLADWYVNPVGKFDLGFLSKQLYKVRESQCGLCRQQVRAILVQQAKFDYDESELSKYNEGLKCKIKESGAKKKRLLLLKKHSNKIQCSASPPTVAKLQPQMKPKRALGRYSLIIVKGDRHKRDCHESHAAPSLSSSSNSHAVLDPRERLGATTNPQVQLQFTSSKSHNEFFEQIKALGEQRARMCKDDFDQPTLEEQEYDNAHNAIDERTLMIAGILPYVPPSSAELRRIVQKREEYGLRKMRQQQLEKKRLQQHLEKRRLQQFRNAAKTQAKSSVYFQYAKQHTGVQLRDHEGIVEEETTSGRALRLRRQNNSPGDANGNKYATVGNANHANRKRNGYRIRRMKPRRCCQFGTMDLDVGRNDSHRRCGTKDGCIIM